MQELTDIMGTRYLQDWHLSDLLEKTSGMKEIDLVGIRVSERIAIEFLNMQKSGVTLVDSGNPVIEQVLRSNEEVLRESELLEGLERRRILASSDTVLETTATIRNTLEDCVFYLDSDSSKYDRYTAIFLLLLAKDKRVDLTNQIDSVFNIIRSHSILSDWNEDTEFYEAVGNTYVTIKVDENGDVTTLDGSKLTLARYIALETCIPTRILNSAISIEDPSTPRYVFALVKMLMEVVKPVKTKNESKITMLEYLNI